MAITFRRTHAPTTNEAHADPEIPTLPSTFDQDELVAVAEYLAQNAVEGLVDWDECARELCAWADADQAALTVAATATSSDHAITASAMLQDAAALAAD